MPRSRGLGALRARGRRRQHRDRLAHVDRLRRGPAARRGELLRRRTDEMAAASAISSTDGGYNFSDDTSCGFTAPPATEDAQRPDARRADEQRRRNADPAPARGQPVARRHPAGRLRVDVDQRGITRPQGTGCDIGAVEVEVVVAPAPRQQSSLRSSPADQAIGPLSRPSRMTGRSCATHIQFLSWRGSPHERADPAA